MGVGIYIDPEILKTKQKTLIKLILRKAYLSVIIGPRKGTALMEHKHLDNNGSLLVKLYTN